MFRMITSVMNPSKTVEVIRRYSTARSQFSGGRIALIGTILADACIVSAHCCCSGVIVADPSSAFRIREKLSTTTPTKRLIAKM